MLSYVVIFLFGIIIAISLIAKKWRPGKRIPTSLNANPLPGCAVRSLGVFERWYSVQHDAQIYFNFSFAFKFEGSIPSEEHMRLVVSHLIGKYPSLSCAIVNKDDDKEPPYFVKVDQVEQKVCKFEKNPSWKDVILLNHHTPFNIKDITQPLWKLIFLQGNNPNKFILIASFHHSICDGSSGIRLCQDLLRTYEMVTSSSSSPNQSTTKYQQQQFLPMEDLLDIRPTLWNIIKQVSMDSFPFLRSKSQTWLGPPDSQDERTGGLVYISLNETELENLYQQCRSQGTTINAALCAALQFSAAVTLNNFNLEMSISSAVNLRPYCSPIVSADQTGPILCAPDLHRKIQPNESFWNLARLTRRCFDEGIIESYQLIGILKFLPGSWLDFLKRRKKRVPNGRDHSIHISNLGRTEFEKIYGGCKLKRVWFSSVKGPEGPVYQLNVATVHGKLTATLGYPVPTIEDEMAQSFSDNCFKILKKATTGDLLLKDCSQ